MNDFIAGPSTDARDGGSVSRAGGGVPPVLLAVLGVAVLVAVTLIAFVAGNGSGSGRAPVPAGAAGRDDPGQTGAPVTDARVLLTVAIEGGGGGKVTVEPRGVTCTETCERQLVVGTRVTLVADAVDGSRFEGWEDACSGMGRCTFVIDRERSVTATFEGAPNVNGQCEDGRDNDGDGVVDAADPGCRSDDTEAPDNRLAPADDCHDGRDNDSDGLVDSAQDPGCAADGTETDPGSTPPAPIAPPPATTTPVAPPPPPASTTTAPAPAPVPAVSECRDGRDNDGDGKTDRPADPGCDSDATEAGG